MPRGAAAAAAARSAFDAEDEDVRKHRAEAGLATAAADERSDAYMLLLRTRRGGGVWVQEDEAGLVFLVLLVLVYRQAGLSWFELDSTRQARWFL